MDVKPGYKQTDMGVIPEDWEIKTLDTLFKFSGGYSASRAQLSTEGHYYLHYGDIHGAKKTYIDTLVDSQIIPKLKIPLKQVSSDSLLKDGDVVFVDASEDDEGASRHVVIVNKDNLPFISGLHTIVAKSKTHELSHKYRRYCFQTEAIKRQFLFYAVGTKVTGISKTNIKKIALPVPPISEQEAIAEALSDADAYIESLEQLIAKKRQVKQGAMQDLLTGKRRLPGFTKGWREARIEEIALPISEKNHTAKELPVLTCSKHLGFVDSLSYFKNQVFSEDTSNYKVIRRGQIGYPANHVEEGSIGLQDLYDAAIVSPIYVVFAVKEGVNSYFLHRLLKLDTFRQKFAAATSASVDRRGSLRWPAFSQLLVNLPHISEQNAIAKTLSGMEEEIDTLVEKLQKTRKIKQGMLQELLTGRIRLI